jgi:hypothetical protein
MAAIWSAIDRRRMRLDQKIIDTITQTDANSSNPNNGEPFGVAVGNKPDTSLPRLSIIAPSLRTNR